MSSGQWDPDLIWLFRTSISSFFSPSLSFVDANALFSDSRGPDLDREGLEEGAHWASVGGGRLECIQKKKKKKRGVVTWILCRLFS